MAHDNDDPVTNVSRNPYFADILAERLRAPSRRDILRGLGALGVMTGGSALLAACGDDIHPATDAGPQPNPDAPIDAPPVEAPSRPTALGFAAVDKSLADRVVVADGYTATPLYSLGDPIAAGLAAFKNDGTEDPASFEKRSGDHHDGMHFFGLDGSGYGEGASDRGLLVMNHEAITSLFLHPTGQSITTGVRTVAAEVQREFFAHGVSVIEVQRSTAGAWSYVQGSAFNRRVHTLTPMELSGPVRGNALVRTKFSTGGTQTRGTVNNCANGYTPWGTYLTCEENWAGFFRRVTADDNAKRSAKELTAFSRYAVAGNGTHLWATVVPDTSTNDYGRWNTMVLGASATEDYRNVSNTFGWVVEIDPFTNTSTPKKRTALGRFAHEGAWPATPVAGKPLVYYCGDDGRGEYIYKFVSSASWDPADAARTDRLAVGDKYLDSGKLYVARFDADGTGKWLELAINMNGITPDNVTYAFADQADVLVHARLAADAAGATKMDRPEWGAVDPLTGAVYFTLTNNTTAVRPLAAVDAANPRHYNDPKGAMAQLGNPNGHIIRWKEPSPEALSFTWDVFLFGAADDADPANVNLSGLTKDNDFSSPDGLWFSLKTNILWIETDDAAYTDVTNCMLLAALPGSVGDGGTKVITNKNPANDEKSVTTYVGAQPGTKLKRFLVGPKDCEITGITETPDGKALFVNIQHPGEETTLANLATPNSTWPASVAGARPRSTTLVITKNDGGIIGL